MADTRPDVILYANTWTNLYTASGIAVGTAVDLYNKGSNPINIVIKATQPTDTSLGVMLNVVPYGQDHAYVTAGESGLWAFSPYLGRVLVQEDV